MKLIAADIVLLIAGLLLLGGATAGLVATGGISSVTSSGSPSGLFNVTYAASSKNIGDKQVSSYASGSQEFGQQNLNVSKATFTVACTAQQSAQVPYTVTVQITGPGGISKQDTVNCGTNKDIVIDVARVPAGGTVSADSEQEAEKNVPQDANATTAQGTWTVRYTGSRSGTVGQLPVGGQLPHGSGTITMKVDQWKPTFTAVAK